VQDRVAQILQPLEGRVFDVGFGEGSSHCGRVVTLAPREMEVQGGALCVDADRN
jgi:hypothetical protein